MTTYQINCAQTETMLLAGAGQPGHLSYIPPGPVGSDDQRRKREFLRLLSRLDVSEPLPGSLLSEPISFAGESCLAGGWIRSMTRFQEEESRTPPRILGPTRSWVRDTLTTIANGSADDTHRALMAEVEACLRLSWAGSVERIAEGEGSTPDFRLGDLFVEVYCPQQHTYERKVVDHLLAQGLANAEGPAKVAVAVGHLTTGSGRRVEGGEVRRDSANKALSYPTNKTIDRVLNGKRDSDQFQEGRKNILWLDLRHGLRLGARDCAPLVSMTTQIPSIVGMFGVWHAFYGQAGEPLFVERTSLEYSIRVRTYEQRPNGFFRTHRAVSASVLSLGSGDVLLFANPWATTRLGHDDMKRLFMLAELRPELSFWDPEPGALESRVSQELGRIRWLANMGH